MARDCAVDKFDWGMVDRSAVLSEAEYFFVIFEIKVLLYSELPQRSMASNHVFGKPLILFLDDT